MGRRGTGGVLVIAASAVVFLVYLLSSPDARFEADDAYDYAAAVERAEYADLLNPHHPIYLPLIKVIYTGVETVSDVRGLDLMVALGSLFAAGTVILFYFALRNWFDAPTPAALFGAASLGASYFFWRYAGEAEIYAFAAFAAVVLLWASVSWIPRPATIAGISALAVVAVLAHSVNAALILALPLILRKRGWERKQLVVAGGIALVLLGMSTFAIYELAKTSSYGPASETSFVGFYLGDSVQAQVTLSDIASTVGVLGSVFVGSNSLFVIEPTRAYLTRAFDGNSMAEELVMGATAPPWVGAAGLATVVLLGASVLLLIWKVASTPRSDSKKGLLTPAFVWCSVYIAVVLFGGVTAQPEVWALFPLPFWASVTGLVARREIESTVLAAVPLSLAVTTLFSGLLPLYSGDNRLEATASWFVDEGRPGDLVLTADSASLARYIAYESEAHAAHIGYQGMDERAVEMIETLGLLLRDGAPTSELVAYLQSSGSISGYREASDLSGRLLLTADAFDPPEWLQKAKPLAAAALAELGDEYRHLFEPVDSSGEALGRISDLEG